MRGSIVWRCRKCRKNARSKLAACNHKGAGYHIVYWYHGKQRWQTAGAVRKDAERKLADIVSQINNGDYHKPKEILFADFANRWLEQYAKGAVKDSTFASYRFNIKNWLIPEFGKIPLSKIAPEMVQAFVTKTLAKRKPKTVNNMLTKIKTMFKHAKRWKYIRENPAEDIPRVRVDFREMDYLTPDEIRLLIGKANEPFKTLLLTAILTGMRRGELLGLQWGDVDWNSNTIFVQRSLYWRKTTDVPGGETRWRFVAPKSRRSVRAIVMSPVLRKALEIHRITCPVSPFDLIFCHHHDGNPIDANNMINREFIPTLVRAGLRRIRFHDLRHSYCSLLIAQGENVKFIQSQLGHASIQTTIDRYGHLMPIDQHDIGQRLDDQVFSSGKVDLEQQPSESCVLAHIR